MTQKIERSKFPELLNSIEREVRDSYSGMFFIEDLDDLASCGFTQDQLDEVSAFADEYNLTDVIEINDWDPYSKPDYILSAYPGLVDKIEDLEGRVRPNAEDISPTDFKYLNSVKAEASEHEQAEHIREVNRIINTISESAIGQDIAFAVQKINFAGINQIGEPEYELLPLGPTAELGSSENLDDFLLWFPDDFKNGIDFGCDKNDQHIAMLVHTGMIRNGNPVDQLITFHQLDFSNTLTVAEKFSFEGRPESNEFMGNLDELFHDPSSLVSSNEIIDEIRHNDEGNHGNDGMPCREHARLFDKVESAKSACDKITATEHHVPEIEKLDQVEAK